MHCSWWDWADDRSSAKEPRLHLIRVWNCWNRLDPSPVIGVKKSKHSWSERSPIAAYLSIVIAVLGCFAKGNCRSASSDLFACKEGAGQGGEDPPWWYGNSSEGVTVRNAKDLLLSLFSSPSLSSFVLVAFNFICNPYSDIQSLHLFCEFCTQLLMSLSE